MAWCGIGDKPLSEQMLTRLNCVDVESFINAPYSFFYLYQYVKCFWHSYFVWRKMLYKIKKNIIIVDQRSLGTLPPLTWFVSDVGTVSWEETTILIMQQHVFFSFFVFLVGGFGCQPFTTRLVRRPQYTLLHSHRFLAVGWQWGW